MKKLTVLNKSIITAVCVALCVVLPMALHAIPKGGVLFSPMHLPVLLCGLVCGGSLRSHLWYFRTLCIQYAHRHARLSAICLS